MSRARVMAQARGRCWEGDGESPDDPWQRDSNKGVRLQREVKKRIKPVKKVGEVMRIGEEVLSEEESARVWAEFFRAQTTVGGPRSADEILKEIRDGDGVIAAQQDLGPPRSSLVVRCAVR